MMTFMTIMTIITIMTLMSMRTMMTIRKMIKTGTMMTMRTMMAMGKWRQWLQWWHWWQWGYYGDNEPYWMRTIMTTVTHNWQCVLIREAPLKFTRGAFGHCPFSFWTPPTRTQTGTLGHFFPGWFEQLFQITVLRVYKCHKESWQALNPLLTKENAQMNFNFHCISAPNHPGKGLDPPKIKHIAIWSWQILL